MINKQKTINNIVDRLRRENQGSKLFLCYTLISRHRMPTDIICESMKIVWENKRLNFSDCLGKICSYLDTYSDNQKDNLWHFCYKLIYEHHMPTQDVFNMMNKYSSQKPSLEEFEKKTKEIEIKLGLSNYLNDFDKRVKSKKFVRKRI